MSENEKEAEEFRTETLYFIPERPENDEPKVLKLLNMCLNSICENIDRYNSAYYYSKDKEIKKLLSNLQRVHSDAVIKILMKKNNSPLDRQYFDLLINQYLKKLQFSFFGAEDLSTVLEMLLPKIGDGLENVEFSFNPTVQEKGVEMFKKLRSDQFVKKVIPHLPNVKIIKMENFSCCDDSTLELIYSSCKELKELRIEYCPITSAGLKSLCPEGKTENTFNLQSLALISVKDCDEGVSHLLKNLPSLECIIYENLPKVLHELHVDDLRKNSLRKTPKYNLTFLHFHETENFDLSIESFEETLLIASELCPRVSNISVFNIMREKQLQILTRFSDLSDVSIEGKDALLDVGDFLQHSGKNMRHMEIRSFKLAVSTIVENCQNLESLCLGNIVGIYENKKSSIILRNLKKLVFENLDEDNESSEMVVEQLLDSCPYLEDLKFFDCFCNERQMSGVIQKFCEKSQKLQKLTFECCVMEEALSLQRIVLTCTPLKKLVIDFCENIRPHQIKNLRNMIKASDSGVVVCFVNLHKYDDEDEDEDDDEWEDVDDCEDEDEGEDEDEE